MSTDRDEGKAASSSGMKGNTAMGMTLSELQEVAKDRPHPTHGPIWSEQVYGLGKWLKRFVGYPDTLPLCAQIDHGPSRSLVASQMDMASQAPILLFHHAVSAQVTREFVAKPCAVMGAPFVYCRRLHGFQKAKDAQGTVAFPSHSTHHIRVSGIDWKKYCRDLRAIPERWQPVSICLYWKDILHGLHSIFLEEGFPVYCAGHMYDDGFTERFYRILSRHKYVTSNEVGTASFYAVEMGLPFFLWGEQEVSMINSGGELSYPKGEIVWKDLIGYYMLDSTSLESLAQAGLFPVEIQGLRKLIGRKVKTPGDFLALLKWEGDLARASAFESVILKAAQRPFGNPWDVKPFLQPLEKVSAEQKAYVDRYLGLRDALPASVLREILWRAFDTFYLGKSGDGLAVFGRVEETKPPVSSGQACPACDSMETSCHELPLPDLNSVTEKFEICRVCGSAFRGAEDLHPPPEWDSPVSNEVHGQPTRLNGLERILHPHEALVRFRNSREKESRIAVDAPCIGGGGLRDYVRDAEIRILFTVTGLRYLLRRSGYQAISVTQGEDGRLKAEAEPLTSGFTPIIAPPEEAVLRTLRLLGIDTGPIPAAPDDSHKSSPPTAATPVDTPVAQIAKALESMRINPSAPEPYQELAAAYRNKGEPGTSEQWLGLYLEAAFSPSGPPSIPAEKSATNPADEDDSGLALMDILECIGADRNEEALRLIDNKISGGMGRPEYPYARALVLNRLNREGEAAQTLRDLLTAWPEHEKAREMLAEMTRRSDAAGKDA